MEAKLPPFAMIEFYFGDSDAALTVMSRGKRFSISITTEDLRGTHGDELVQTFLDYKKNMDDDPYVMEEFQEWMVKPCVFYMDQFKSSTPRVEPPSLEEYFAPDTAIIKLTNAEGSLKATMCPGNPLDTQSFTPRIAMSDPTVQEAISRGLPLTPAAQLKAVLGPEAYEADYDLIPTTVQVIGKETQFHFKGAFEKQSFRRELDILLRLRSDAFPDNLRVSRLGGLVLHDDGVSLLGLLVEHIHDSETLDEAMEESSEEEREKWMQQLRAIVKQLHDGGVIWGDVKPDNVLVDSNNDVWVIDFGGGCAEGWVDQEVGGTVEGDLQGLASIAGFLGL
jgi:serine/threonine protein kinase